MPNQKDENNLQKEVGTSEGSSTLYEYTDSGDVSWRPPVAYGVYAEEVEAHFAALFPGRESSVFHELVSDLVHIDVHIMRPTAERAFFVIFTTGMSDLAMTLPEGIAEEHRDLERAELFMMLPPDWDPGDAYQTTADIPYEQFWPVQLIKYLARFPHEYRTWLGWGHTIPNGPDYSPILDDSGMGGVVLLEPGADFSPLTTEEGTPIHFYMTMPAYKEEIEYKLEQGMSALDDLFAERDLPLVVDMYRENYCK